MLSGLTGTTGQVLTLDNSNAPTFGKVNLGATAAITGTLPVANGGSGLTATPTNGQILRQWHRLHPIQPYRRLGYHGCEHSWHDHGVSERRERYYSSNG